MKRLILSALALATTIGACFPIEGPRQYPEWHLPKASSAIGCGALTAWMSKSGKEGALLTIRLQGSTLQACHVQIASVAVKMHDQVHPASKLPPPPVLVRGSEVFVYVPIPFDGDAAWNDEESRKGTIDIGVVGEQGIILPFEVTLRDNHCEDPNEIYAVQQ